jgi:hypothetical protein
MEQNKIMNKEHKEFLDEITTNGVNIFTGATNALMEHFDISESEARLIIKEWFATR